MEKEEMKWKRDCDISELPTRLRRLAEYRNEHCHFIGDNTNGVNSFYWGDTPEGSTFWAKVCSGIAPSNLEEVLDRFEKEHPDESDFPMMPQSSMEVLLDPVEELNEPDPHSDEFWAEFRKAAEPLMDFINKYYPTGCKVVVTKDGAEIVKNVLWFKHINPDED